MKRLPKPPPSTNTNNYLLPFTLVLTVLTLLFLAGGLFRSSPTRSTMTTSATDLASQVNHLASLLLPEPSASSPSTILSAYGVVHALSMLIPGAGPSTPSHTALLSTLYGHKDEAAAQRAIKDLSISLQNILEEANAAFLARSLQIQASYRSVLEEGYAAEIHPLDSADKVNDWVAEKTHDRITSIIDDSCAAPGGPGAH